MDQTKLFHPSILDSLVQVKKHGAELQGEDLMFAAVIANLIGWRLQQGFPAEACAEILVKVITANRDTAIRACAAVVQALNQDGRLGNL